MLSIPQIQQFTHTLHGLNGQSAPRNALQDASGKIRLFKIIIYYQIDSSAQRQFLIVFNFRRCKMKEICGNKIIRQRAYCFPRTRGNFCERWISEQNESLGLSPFQQKSTKEDYTAYAEQRISKRLSDATKITPEYTAQSINCGFSLGKRKSSKSIYEMLKIIGGKTAKRGKWPWQVAVLNRFKVRSLKKKQRRISNS